MGIAEQSLETQAQLPVCRHDSNDCSQNENPPEQRLAHPEPGSVMSAIGRLC